MAGWLTASAEVLFQLFYEFYFLPNAIDYSETFGKQMAHSKGSNGKSLQKDYLQVHGQILKIPQVIRMLGGLILFPLSEGAREGAVT